VDGIIVATVRPETIPGDVAVAVNPKDKRFAALVGKTVINPITGTKIPVIADDYVDMKFGTGALKITPAHDMNDFAIGERHGLKPIIVPDLSDDAREKVVAQLKKSGNLVDQKKYSGNVSVCYRCFHAVEPTLSEQWFVKMQELAKPAIEAIGKKGVNGGRLEILPRKFEKVYLHWLNNIKDWCISRQLLSGHRIPIEGETDVLDTWFSSALWPFSVFGWGKDDKNGDFKYFYPTETLVTGYDIIFFWVIRMVFSGLAHTGELPFRRVLLNGLVRDMKGKKMSKSAGNGIDPVKIIDEFGTDVLRFSLIVGTRLDRDPRYGVEKAEKARNFINKIWNATKFVMAHSANESGEGFHAPETPADKWILTKLTALIKSVTKKYEKFDFGVAAAELQQFFWANFCDWYIEESKANMNPALLRHVLETFLRLLAPIMPFVTEWLWTRELGHETGLLRASFPTENKKLNFAKEAEEFDRHIEEVRAQRAIAFEAENRGKIVAALEKEIARANGLLSNANFVKNAPKAVVEAEREKLSNARAEIEKLKKGCK
jgi:valyl-tRNA synthetase